MNFVSRDSIIILLKIYTFFSYRWYCFAILYVFSFSTFSHSFVRSLAHLPLAHYSALSLRETFLRPFSTWKTATTTTTVKIVRIFFIVFLPSVKPVWNCWLCSVTQSLLHFHLLFLIANFCRPLALQLVNVQPSKHVNNCEPEQLKCERQKITIYSKPSNERTNERSNEHIEIGNRHKLLCDRTVKDVTSIKI